MIVPAIAVCAPENAVRGGDIYAAGNGGQRLQRSISIAGLLVSRLGLREVATGGDAAQRLQRFLGLALTEIGAEVPSSGWAHRLMTLGGAAI